MFRNVTPQPHHTQTPEFRAAVRQLVNELEFSLFMGSLTFTRFHEAFMTTIFGKEISTGKKVDDYLIEMRNTMEFVIDTFWQVYCATTPGHQGSSQMCTECRAQVHMLREQVIITGTNELVYPA